MILPGKSTLYMVILTGEMELWNEINIKYGM